MSESVEEAPAEGAETPVEAPEPQTEQEEPEQPTEAVEAPKEPQAPKEPPWFMKRIDAMNRRNADLARELAALKQQQAPGQLEPTQPTDNQPKAPAELTQQAIRAEAERLRAEEDYKAALKSVIDGGAKEYGAQDWNAKTQLVAGLGATDNPAFMEALVALPDAHKLVASLADDPDRLSTLLAKRPAAMAAEMGRMAAAMESAPAKPVLSKAPAPVKPIASRGTAAEPDPSKMSMKEYVAWREANAPRNLGGKRQRA